MKSNLNVALIGNPNVGKTSIFNELTGLNQKTGNYPGITVEKKTGISKLSDTSSALIIDLPGTYSIHANSLDEEIVSSLLLDKENKLFPDIVVVVAEVENLKRNLLLFTQIKDFGIPTILVINMADIMEKRGITIDIPALEAELKTKIVLACARKKEGISELKSAILEYHQIGETTPSLNASEINKDFFNRLQNTFPEEPIYKLWLVFTDNTKHGDLTRESIEKAGLTYNESEVKRLQQKEIIKRYQFINDTLKKTYKINSTKGTGLRSRIDNILTHKVFGYLIFFSILLLIFQAIFDWSEYPKGAIEDFFAFLSEFVTEKMEPGILTDLIADGIIPGIGAIMPFIPQIAILFMFISLFEEVGYMSRIVFLMDKLMRPFGLSGKSIVPLISGNACAIPAIMSARNIENWKERLLTILVVPFTTCSARIPVYIILISLIIPEERIFGFINLQGLTLGLLYFLGFFTALCSAWLLNKIIKSDKKSYFIVEMPAYRFPIFKNVFITMFEKTKAFVYGAGKIIFVLSIFIWFLGSHGPGEKFKNAEEIITEKYSSENISEEEIDEYVSSFKLENSYIGLLGKGIEPIIKPLGYDWKIGVAVLTSFVAREVFVGTLATLYNIGSQGDEMETIKEKMEAEIRPDTGGKVFSFATGVSLLLFYAFAMQCSATIATTKRETNSWKWTLFQLTFMTTFAYIVSMIAYQFLK